MTAFNIVRFRVKPGRELDFLDAHRAVAWPGLRQASIIELGEGGYCLIAQWEDRQSLAAARPQMIATLDTFRDTLEELDAGRGVTDAVSGAVVLAVR